MPTLTAANRLKLEKPIKDLVRRRPEFVNTIVFTVTNGGAGKINKGLISEIVQDYIKGGIKIDDGAKIIDRNEVLYTETLHLVKMQGGGDFLTDDAGSAALSA